MLSQEIRRQFLNYFKQKGHKVVPSSSVIPHDDPTLLFINAGMNQFKDVFLGKSERDYKRAATAQKCIRAGGKHNDLDNVGHTARHLTFFEMLGNFSFGDYFKKEAIQYAWEVTTQVFRFEPEFIRVTVFETDDEAYELWKEIVPEKYITRMGEKDNFWMMGETGPCGPCSELYYDRGTKYGNAPSPKEDIDGLRYLEYWNLVFMQFNRDIEGKMLPLPKKSIDTGSGLERVASLKINAETVFETDILRGLIAQVEKLCGKKYEINSKLAPAFHVIADHIRSISFAIADGAQPSNIERGYVLRKILRRAVRYGRMLDLQKPFLAGVLPKLVELMGDDYHELRDAQGRIAEILTLEEESFIRTLKKGGNILSSIIDESKKSSLKQIRGEDAFKLKDTYGLPIEEILLIAKDEGLEVNIESYQILEEQAKEKSRGAQTVHAQEAEENLFKDYIQKNGLTEFLGFTALETESKVTGLVVNGQFVQELKEGEEGTVLLNRTPFYAEKGGQVGDTGTLASPKAHFTVSDCRSPYSGVVAHTGKLEKGSLRVGDTLLAQIDSKRRGMIEHNHTATHLLHWALQKILGPHIKQAGSLVEAERFRFDFNHHKALTSHEIRLIEELVNDKIRENSKVSIYELTLDEVQKRSDIKQFFGDKYGSKVRVIDIDFSKELCGGTHVAELGVIGLFRIVKESSIAAGVRRIEAVTGKAAEAYMYQIEDLAQSAAASLKSTLLQLPEKISGLIDENRQITMELKNLRRSQLKQLGDDLSKQVEKVGNISLIAQIVEVDSADLPLLADDVMSKVPSVVLILAAKAKDRCQLFVKVSADYVQKGVQAGALVKEIAPIVGGSGGGKAESAQAGGKNPEKLHEALEKAKKWLQTF